MTKIMKLPRYLTFIKSQIFWIPTNQNISGTNVMLLAIAYIKRILGLKHLCKPFMQILADDTKSASQIKKFIIHPSMQLWEDSLTQWPSERRTLLSSQHSSGLIPETESHIIPWSLRIPYHPLQMLTRHANQIRLRWVTWDSCTV